jgi:hypothetical protein
MTTLAIMRSYSASMQEAIVDHELLCQKQLKQVMFWLLVVVALGFLTAYLNADESLKSALPLEFAIIASLIISPFILVLMLMIIKYTDTKYNLTTYFEWLSRFEGAAAWQSAASIQGLLSEAQADAKLNHLLLKLLEHYQPLLNERLSKLHQRELTKELNLEWTKAELSLDVKVLEISNSVPLLKARNQIESSLKFLRNRREKIEQRWEASYKSFSWWNKIKYMGGPDFSEIDKAISELDALKGKMAVEYENDLQNLDNHFEQLKQKAIMRMSTAKVDAQRYIQDCSYQDTLNSDLLKKSLWLAALSVPVSVWNDLDSAGNIYDVLRDVNSNFEGMSDAGIWLETLFLPAESLAGLAALTKGAYFEQLVAADTGGQLHEHFNHADTDIVIDGIAFQIKATDSESYIYSVEESIPVIATSEVALTTGVIDGGYSNVDITSAVDEALGGSIVDMGDTAGDAILAGLGGLGFFATLNGINHASAKYENGGDAVESIFEGAGVAVVGTARALVGTVEMGYNILASEPSRYVGRTVLKGLDKVGKKLLE